MKPLLLIYALLMVLQLSCNPSGPSSESDAPAADPAGPHDWMQSARIFLMDAYGYPFVPELEFDAEKLAALMVDMHANTVRLATMGNYATIQGVRFPVHPDQGERDLLAETIAACKPHGIRVVPYISTGHKLPWPVVTQHFPEYAQRTRPGGGPDRTRWGVGDDKGTVCWNTPYRQAYLDLIEHVVRDYDIDGMYFDTWWSCYFWPAPRTCYCEGCVKGFKNATGFTLPFREQLKDYTTVEWEIIDRYYDWYQDELMSVLAEVRRIVKSHKDIPLIYNVNDPDRLRREDSRLLQNIDAFLYERGRTMVERAEGISLARAMGLKVWPYVAGSHGSRIMTGGLNFQQEIFTTAMFGGGPIVPNPYYFTEPDNDREPLRYPFSVINRHESLYTAVDNVPYVLVLWEDEDPPGATLRGRYENLDVRSATRGAFTACLYQHVQVSSAIARILDDPARLGQYKVVYLANIPSLTPGQIENLKAFVDGGGGLIVSYNSTLYEKQGKEKVRPGFLRSWKGWMPLPDPVTWRKRETFALEELLRVHPLEPAGKLAKTLHEHMDASSGPRDVYLQMRSDSGLQDLGRKDRLAPLWHFQPVEVLDGGQVLADIVTGYDRQPVLPGIVLSRHGQGCVIYLAPALESLYAQSNIKALELLIREVIHVATPAPAPYEIDAPSALIANMTMKGNTRILHLTNWTGNKREGWQFGEDYLAPVRDVHIRIQIPEGRKLRDVKLLVDAVFEQQIRGNTLLVTIPEIQAYQAIALDLE